ncbi:MAG: ATP-binding cassette domain-containing protein [Bacteroidetes bacterium]|nr:ATP-binding cassette domain-containing protein [Bacteroidota bacterium]
MNTEKERIINKNTEAHQVPVVLVRHLFKHFGENQVLNDFSFELFKGENLVVLGKSGSGKSVLIRCIVGLLKPDSGEINVLGKSIPELDSREVDRLREKVGFLFQGNALYDSMTVRENLEFPLRRHWIKKSKEEVNTLVIEALTNVGLAHTVDMMPEALSGGMRKRIALARTLILKPEVILYDEPTTGLDPITGKEISNLILELQKKYKTSSIIISHDMDCVKIVANKIVMLIDEKCYASGTYSELEKSTDEKIKHFFD